MTADKQLAEWVKGNSIHNDTRDECCPDFSCCQPELLADEATRTAFEAANDEDRMQFLGMFLGAGMAAMMPEKKVYIAGVDDPEAETH